MKVLLVDDEQLQLTRLKEVCEHVFPLGTELYDFTNPLLAVEKAEKEKIDIAFLDVTMPHLNGIHLAKKLKTLNPEINIIFVTAFDNYALDAYRMHVSGYVMKPVTEEKIREELEVLRHYMPFESSTKLQVKCFGNFEVFYNGEPLKFKRSKTKELFAFLVDREGSIININDAARFLWEEVSPSYMRNLIADIQQTLKSIGMSDVFVKRHNECFIIPEKIDCDAYEYKKNNPDAIRAYRGEYMIQYSWGMFDAND